MNTFALDKNYSQLNFDEISVDDLEIISGGTGLANVNDGLSTGYYTTTRGYTFTTNAPGNTYTNTTVNTQTYTYTYINSSGTSVTGGGSVFA